MVAAMGPEAGDGRDLSERREVNRWGYRDEIMGYPVYRVRDVLNSVLDIATSLDPSVIVAQNVFALAQTCILAGFPTLLYLRHTDLLWLFPGGRQPPWYDLSHPLLGYVANSRFTGQFYEKSLGIRLPVIEPILAPEAYRTKTSRRKVVFVNPVPVKGVDIALRLAAARPDILFEVVEAWPLSAEESQALIERCRPLDNVTLRRSVADMREIYREAKLLLVPSRWQEGWARVVTEVQASGIPVLASCRGGLPESVGAGGILVDPDADLGSWTKALSLLWDDEAAYARYAEAALAHSRRAEIQPKHLVDRFLELVSGHAALVVKGAEAARLGDIGLSVIVPTYRCPAGLDRLLTSLREQVEGNTKYQVIVVNDGSHDERYAAVIERHCDFVAYVAAPQNRGPAAARNLGAAQAQGDFIVFIDDDCVSPPYWLDWLCAILAENPDVDVVGGTTEPLPSPKAGLFETFLAEAGFHPRPYLLDDLPVLVTANLAVRRTAFEAVGGFDETMLTTEDRNLCYRLEQRRAIFHLDPGWFAYHDMATRVWRHFRRYYRYGLGIRREIAMEDSPPDLSRWPQEGFALHDLPARVAALVARVKDGDRHEARPWATRILFMALAVLTWLAVDLGYVRAIRDSEADRKRRREDLKRKFEKPPRARVGKGPARFLIFALGRTGSTALMRALNCHPAIRCIHEPFNIRDLTSRFGGRARDRATLIALLDEIAAEYNGIKHVWNPLGWPFLESPELNFEVLTNFGPVLLLHRANILRRLVSAEIAQQADRYQLPEQAAQYRRNLRWFPFHHLDRDRLKESLEAETQAIEKARRRLRAAGVPSLELTYEQLYAPGCREDRVRRMAPIFQFLGLAIEDLSKEALRSLSIILDPAANKLNDETIYSMVPDILGIEAEFGSDATGWLFH